MIWARMLAYITGTVDQELLLRNEYLAAENRILRAQIKGRLLLSDAERATLAEIAYLSFAKTDPAKNQWFREGEMLPLDGRRRNRYVVNHRIIESLSVGIASKQEQTSERQETDGCCSLRPH